MSNRIRGRSGKQIHSICTTIPTVSEPSSIKKPKKQKEFTCETCFKVFGRNSHLQRHIKIHTRVYKCSKCNEQFEKWSLLQKHMKSHKFECFTCGKQLSSQKTLSMHLKTHDKTIVFPCPVCGKEFNRNQNLLVHHRTVHLGLKPFECVCGLSFGHKHLLHRHIRTFQSTGYHAKVSTDLPDTEAIFTEDIPIVEPAQLESGAAPEEELNAEGNELPLQPILASSNILNDLTGFGHSRFSTERPISCYVDGCSYRFKRIYDLQRHVLSFHSMGMEMDIRDADEVFAH
jgi:uncharacterized Zn-finger protein